MVTRLHIRVFILQLFMFHNNVTCFPIISVDNLLFYFANVPSLGNVSVANFRIIIFRASCHNMVMVCLFWPT